MCVHLVTNASVLNSPATFQKNVYSIHSIGLLLPIVEWGFIFLPILFHAIFGVIIIRSGLPNQGSYPTASNYRYTLQRASGMVAFAFIAWHVFHMHGWFHFDWWRTTVAEPLGGAQFVPYRAASSAGIALGSLIVRILYAVGVLACVFHLANGIWTMGITWGVWVSPAAQRKATVVCTVFGVGLAFVGLSALWGMSSAGQEDNVEDARKAEDQMFEAKLASGELQDNRATQHKRGDFVHPVEGDEIEPAEEGPAEIETSTTSSAITAPPMRNSIAPSDTTASRQESP
jgi:succinate dehydrogenase / fumarate reductase cytochrome b subunit